MTTAADLLRDLRATTERDQRTQVPELPERPAPLPSGAGTGSPPGPDN